MNKYYSSLAGLPLFIYSLVYTSTGIVNKIRITVIVYLKYNSFSRRGGYPMKANINPPDFKGLGGGGGGGCCRNPGIHLDMRIWYSWSPNNSYENRTDFALELEVLNRSHYAFRPTINTSISWAQCNNGNHG